MNELDLDDLISEAAELTESAEGLVSEFRNAETVETLEQFRVSLTEAEDALATMLDKVKELKRQFQ